MATVVAPEVYINGRYVGLMEETSLSFMSNGEQLIAAEAVIESTGVVTTEGEIKSIITQEGPELDLVQLTIDQTTITLSYVTNGKAYMVDGKVNKAALSGNVKTGATKGTHTFRGGKPRAIVV